MPKRAAQRVQDDQVVTFQVNDTPAPVSSAPAPEPGTTRVQVSPRLRDLIKGVPQAESEQRDIDHLVHQVLMAGLIISAVFMVTGLILDFTLQREPPTTIPSLGEILARIRQLRPSGFLAMGLLVLIATPIVRVLGSVLAFVYEQDWRFVAITVTVLIVVSLGVVFGKG